MRERARARRIEIDEKSKQKRGQILFDPARTDRSAFLPAQLAIRGGWSYVVDMASLSLMAAVEEASLLIGRLDSRVSASPLAEAWHIRATILAAETLAAVDGTPTRSVDIVGIMMGAALPSSQGYAPAHVGFAHWRRCIARVDLSDLAARLIGRKATSLINAMEAQEDWDAEDALSSAARQALKRHDELYDPDAYALGVAERSLASMRAAEVVGPKIIGLAKGLRDAIRFDPDPDYFERIYVVRRGLEERMRQEADRVLAALPSPSDQGEAIERRLEDMKASIRWEPKPHLGACFSVVPDRIQELGMTRSRLSCLTGATKRLGFEARLDDRALLGFVRQLALEARAGLALLDSLEDLMAEIARSPEVIIDARSQLPEVLYACLVLPAMDAKWIELALGIQERAARRFVKRLGDAGLITPWAMRRHMPADGQRAREMQLWAPTSFEKSYDRALRRRGAQPGRPAGLALEPSEMIGRYRSVDVSVPMTVVFKRFEDEMLDIDREFGRIWEGKLAKNRSARKPVQSDLR